MCGSGYLTVSSLYPWPIQISRTFPSPIPILVLVSTMALKETRPTCSVLSLTFNKCDHLKETKSVIVPVINSRTFNDIFYKHHDFGLKNNQCKVMSQSHVVTPVLTVGEVVSLFNIRQFNFKCESGLQGEDVQKQMILNKYTDRFFHFTFCLNYFFNLKNILVKTTCRMIPINLD